MTTKNKSTKPATPANQTTPAAEVPDWVSDTHDEATYSYDLMMYEDCGEVDGTDDLTREEYIALKTHLAVMRGYPVPEPNPEATAEPAEPAPNAVKSSDGSPHRLDLEEAATNNIDFLEVCNLALSRDSGSTTPAENLIAELLFRYGAMGTLTPKAIKLPLQEFHENYNDMARDARLFVANNPEPAKPE